MAAVDLRLLAYRSVQLCLEVAAGRRPPAAVDDVVTGEAGRWLRENVASAGPEPARIRRIAIQHDDHRLEVTAVVAAHDQPVSAIALQLRTTDGRWRIAAVEHLHRGQHRQHTVGAEAPPSDQTRTALRGRVTQAVLGGAATASEQRAQTATTWADRATHLTEARRWRALADRMAHRDAPPALDRPAAHLTAMLGTPPRDGPALTAWTRAAGMISNYRRTWNITDPRLPLGASPPDTAEHAAQRADRQRTITTIRTLLQRHRTRDVGRQPPTLEPPAP